MTVLTLNLAPLQLSDEQFYELCQSNRELRLERTATEELVIMPPTGGITGNRNGRLTQQLFNWSERDGTGMAFDASTGFKLPNGAVGAACSTSFRSPDAAWVSLGRWNSLSPSQQERFIPLAPDFVVELLSASDSLELTQPKMQEYLDNGTQLGWLINHKTRQVEIYRPDRAVEVWASPATLSGEPVLPGFLLQLAVIW